MPKSGVWIQVFSGGLEGREGCFEKFAILVTETLFMAKMKDSQLIMLEHSKAKVDLFGRYLSIYLNVISRVPFIKKIYLFDLFAGEGKYLNNEKGSPIVAMECIKNHF